MQANPIRIPTVSNDTSWDFCFHLSQQTGKPAQHTDDLLTTCQCRETEEEEEDTIVQKERMTADCMSLPKQQLAQSQEKFGQLIKENMNAKANKELIRCFILSRIVFGKKHWKCAQALASLAYGYLTLRGLPVQAKKHAESARNILLTWKQKTTSDKEKREILGALIMLYYTLGIAWLLQNHGKQSYIHLQKADRNMKELKELNNGGIGGSHISEKDLTIALGRASIAMRRMNLALAYFEKAISNVIIAKGDGTSDLISLYEEIAQIEQLRKNHGQAIQYLQQAYSLCVSSFSEVSPQTAEASALLAKAYAMSGESQHRDAVQIYFLRSISTYQILGSRDYATLTAIEDFCTWLIQNGEKKEAYKLLKSILNSGTYGVCGEKIAETFYNMGSIYFAKGEVKKAIQLLRKCLMVQILVYGSKHTKSRETKNLLTLLQRSHVNSELRTLRKIANNKNNLVANSNSRTQSVFISMGSRGRAKVEERFLKLRIVKILEEKVPPSSTVGAVRNQGFDL